MTKEQNKLLDKLNSISAKLLNKAESSKRKKTKQYYYFASNEVLNTMIAIQNFKNKDYEKTKISSKQRLW